MEEDARCASCSPSRFRAEPNEPIGEKTYRYIDVVAPIQTGQTATVTLTIEPGVNQTVFTRTLDLGNPPIRKQISVSPPQKGYEAQFNLTTLSTDALEVQRVVVGGWIERVWTVPQ